MSATWSGRSKVGEYYHWVKLSHISNTLYVGKLQRPLTYSEPVRVVREGLEARLSCTSDVARRVYILARFPCPPYTVGPPLDRPTHSDGNFLGIDRIVWGALALNSAWVAVVSSGFQK